MVWTPYSYKVRLLLAAVGLSLAAGTAGAAVGPAPMTAQISVTVDPWQAAGVSRFAGGLTHIDQSLTWGDAAAINSAQTVVAESTRFQNTHLMAWGAADPWPDPSTSGPTNWADLDQRVGLAVAAGATPMITLAEAPWWMKGQRRPDGSTALIPDAEGEWRANYYGAALTDYRGLTYPAGYVSPSPYAARVLDNQMDKWLQLVEAVAERYMAPPYNVRYFQVWNELKGYHNPLTNQWDYADEAGDPSGPNAQHGYTYMYNQVYARLQQVAARLGLPPGSLRIGGPYVTFRTWANPGAGGFPATEPALQGRAYGTYDQRDADAIKYWLQHKVGAQFIVWDGGTKNREGANLVDPYAASERFADTVAWLRGLDPALYPGANTLPVAYAEWYAFPYDTTDPDQQAAVKAYAAMRFIQAGGWLTLLWGGEERAEPHLDASLYTETNQSGGGRALPWAAAYRALQTHFGAGVMLAQTTQTSSDIGVLASPHTTLLVNKTGNALAVSVNGVLVRLKPYQVYVLDTPPLVEAEHGRPDDMGS